MAPLLLIALAQAEMPHVAPVDYALPEERAGGRVLEDCSRRSAGEIVVCGRRGDGYRVKELPLPEGVDPETTGDGSFGIGLAKGVRLEAEQVTRPDGWRDNRVLVKVKIPL
jgi:hypothetical protein